MKLLCCYIALLALVLACSADKIVNKVAHESEKLIDEAQDSGKKIRQCSCDEQNECVESTKHQVDECFETCWKEVKKVGTKNPEDLKKCFKDKRYIVNDVIECATDKLKTCVPGKDGKEIAYTDFKEILTEGEKKILTEVESFSSLLEDSGKEMIDTGVNVGKCMKTCFLQKNTGGFCWDQKKCQPLLDGGESGKTIKTCAKKIGFKKEARDICNCMVESGVEEMKKYCAVLGKVTRVR